MISQPIASEEPIYPDSDGNPMSDNTEQYRWIVIVKENLEIIFAEDPNVFIAGDLSWYPVQGSLERTAPDVMVVFGRPRGRRGSYKQWVEDNIAPQVAFEILSPSNKVRRGIDSLEEKFEFYQEHGIEEYYIYDPDDLILEGWQRQEQKLVKIVRMSGWVSPRLGIRFDWEAGRELVLYRPDGQCFLTSVELAQRMQWAERRAESAERLRLQERQRTESAEQRAESAERLRLQERQRAESAEQRAERLASRLRALGLDIDDV
ncbi:Uma2 family endonuclease [Tumidithrix elongata RA019]|uniref:Uma2 family endonuclease n=1 Tax=Tumidithrix elongata BACA0141 TaxID=2716417 RepID=A0AAW9Q637_9CYAN|nr:Uma2 family endonuclease [Tumidithrix elongata RA019]